MKKENLILNSREVIIKYNNKKFIKKVLTFDIH